MVSFAAEWADKWEGDTGEEGCCERKMKEIRKRGILRGKTERKREGEAGNETVLGQS